MTTLRVLSAGAARGLVTGLSGQFTAATGAAVDGFFSAVGVVRKRFEAGEPCDVLILTARLLGKLEAAGHVRPGSAAPLGAVRTAVAVPQGQPVPDIGTGSAFADAVRAASAVFMPDPHRSTAGIHVRTTEILYTKGLVLVGPLPPEHDLSTIYAAAVSAATALPQLAASLVALLTGTQTAELRQQSGFERWKPAKLGGPATTRRWPRVPACVMPTFFDQDPCARSRCAMDVMVQGCSTSLFQAPQQWSTMSA